MAAPLVRANREADAMGMGVDMVGSPSSGVTETASDRAYHGYDSDIDQS